MKLGICLPHYGRPIEVPRLLEVARHAEARGLDSVWVTDHVIVPRQTQIIYREDMLDPLAVLPWLAGVTSRIGLGTSVVILPYRSPIPVAKLLASVDVLSGGRLMVGAAIGWMEGEFEALGVPFKERVSRSEEALELFRTLWTQPHPEIETKRHRLHDVTFSPMPLQKPRPPLYVGGNSEGALRRVARFGDGWHATATSVDGVPAGRRDGAPLLEGGGAGGRAGAVVADPHRDRRRASRRRRHGADPGRGRHVIGGPVTKIVEELRGFQALGCEHIALEVSYSTYPAIARTIDIIAEQLRPAVAD